MPRHLKWLTFLVLFYATSAQCAPWKIECSLEGSLLLSFQPSKQVVVRSSPNNAFLTYSFYRFKRYKYPGVSYQLRVSLFKKPGFRIGFTSGIQIRYQQKISDNNYLTFYSFPVLLHSEISLLHWHQQALSVQLAAGYNLKHPKYQYLDGLGSWMGSFTMLQRKHHKGQYWRISYDVMRDRLRYNLKVSQLVSGGIDERVNFSQWVHQVALGYGWVLNPKRQGLSSNTR